MTLLAKRTGSFDELVGDLAGDLKDEVEEEEGNVGVVLRVGAGCAFGRLYEGEQVGEKGGPLVDVSAKKEECEGMRELVAEDCEISGIFQ